MPVPYCRICGSKATRKVRYVNAVNNEWLYDCGDAGLAPGAEIKSL